MVPETIHQDTYEQAAWAAEKHLTALHRDIVGNTFYPLPHLPPSLLGWHGGVIPDLAHAAIHDRILPASTLDLARLAVLADAIEEADCPVCEPREHFRGPRPHVRGCWALDRLPRRE